MKKGFTLIELMVVIAVIGILAAALLPTVANLTDRAQAAKILSESNAISTAAIAHKTDTGYWPKSQTTDGAILTMVDNRRGYSNWSGPYLRRPAQRADGRVKNAFDGTMMFNDVNNGFGDDWWCWQAPCSEIGLYLEGIPIMVQIDVEKSLDGRDEGQNGNGRVKRYQGNWMMLVFDAGQQWDGW